MEKIKQIRIKKGITQQQLAKQAGISNVYLSYVEAGKKVPSLSVLNSIAKALNISIKQLF